MTYREETERNRPFIVSRLEQAFKARDGHRVAANEWATRSRWATPAEIREALHIIRAEISSELRRLDLEELDEGISDANFLKPLGIQSPDPDAA